MSFAGLIDWLCFCIYVLLWGCCVLDNVGFVGGFLGFCCSVFAFWGLYTLHFAKFRVFVLVLGLVGVQVWFQTWVAGFVGFSVWVLLCGLMRCGK